jgi:hypothetical protein
VIEIRGRRLQDRLQPLGRVGRLRGGDPGERRADRREGQRPGGLSGGRVLVAGGGRLGLPDEDATQVGIDAVGQVSDQPLRVEGGVENRHVAPVAGERRPEFDREPGRARPADHVHDRRRPVHTDSRAAGGRESIGYAKSFGLNT